MKKLIDYLHAAVAGNDVSKALTIPTAEIAKLLPDAEKELGNMLCWIAGYYNVLGQLKAQVKLPSRCRKDFNNVETFLKFFAADTSNGVNCSKREGK